MLYPLYFFYFYASLFLVSALLEVFYSLSRDLLNRSLTSYDILYCSCNLRPVIKEGKRHVFSNTECYEVYYYLA
jgi:hypothetical protein